MKYKTKGHLYYVYSGEGIESYTLKADDEEEWMKFQLEREIYDLMSGEEFVQLVEDGCINNYDGSVADIFVDGYISNLGLFCVEEDFMEGSFLVTKEMFLEMCKEHKIEVNWANK